MGEGNRVGVHNWRYFQMMTFLVIVHILVCITLVMVVLLQSGKGADIGAAFGSGGSQTVFGSRGAGNFLTKLTAAAGALFMITSLGLAILSSGGGVGGSVVKEETKKSMPAQEGTPAGAPFNPQAPQPSDTAPAQPAAPPAQK
jgi:preprotein translocase subunit SecG